MMDIELNKEQIEDTIKQLDENSNKLLIGNNLFSIDKILTLLNVKTEGCILENANYKHSFSFSYNDEVFKDNINILFYENPNSCYSFLAKSEIIDEKNREAIYNKALKSFRDAPHFTISFIPKEKLNKVVYNEALIFISNGINNGDKQFTQEDFTSKYEAYKEAQDKVNKETYDALKSLYEKIINIKISKKD